MISINPSNQTAFIYKNRSISYKHLVDNINRLSSLLEIKPDDRVIIFSENSPFWVYALFSIWKKGAVATPVDFMSSKQEFEYVLSDCQPSVILCSRERFELIKDIPNLPQTIIIDELDYESLEEDTKQIERKKDDIALILYTSGTTGKPKGVMLSFDNLASNIESILKVNIANSQDKTIAILPFHHSYPLMVSLLIPITIGATIVFLDRLSADDILKKFQDYRVSILVGVPRIYNLFHKRIFDRINSNFFIKSLFKIVKLINNQKISKIVFKKVHQQFGGNVKYFVSGGAKLDVDVARDLWALGFRVVEGYGLTETSPIVSFNPPDMVKLGSVGKVIPHVEVKIKEDGEILVKGRNVFKGYWRKEKETLEAFENGYFKTGDLGYFDDEGYLYITGRKKDIIVLPNGKNINPEEIENQILKISSLVKEVAVIDKEGQLFAIIYPDFEMIKKSGVINLYETIKWNIVDKYNLSAPPYKKITGFTITEIELPKTRLGKIRRFMLKEFLEKQTIKKELSEPNDQIYQIIKDYLKKYTGFNVYPDSHIEIDLGLDSLGKVEFLAFVESTFGVSLSEDFFVENNTVGKIYNHIKIYLSKIELSQVNWSEILKQTGEIDICERCLTVYIKPVLKFAFKLYNRLEIKGVENIPDGPVIFAPNYQSYLDGFLLVSALPYDVLKKTYFLAEEGYFNTPIRRWIARNFCIIPVNINRDLKGSLLKASTALKMGKNIVIFPEGARTRDGSLLEFKKGFAILSRELDVTVVPVVIKGAFESLPINRLLPKPHKIEIKFLKPVYPQDKDYQQIISEVYSKIKENLEGI